MNRFEFVKRLIYYYASQESPHTLYIGDASQESQQQAIQHLANECCCTDRVKYFHWQSLNDRETISKLAEVATEDYCAFTGDDDFLLPDSLTKCAEVLSREHDYRTAQGKGVVLSLDRSGPYGKIKSYGDYWKKNEITSDSGVERLRQFGMHQWSLQFSVHRRSEFIEDSKDYKRISNRSIGELLHCFTFICKGKSKFVDCLYIVRHVHDQQYLLPGFLDWFSSPDWASSYKLFETSIAETLQCIDGISNKEARQVVREEFQKYLERTLRRRNGIKNARERWGVPKASLVAVANNLGILVNWFLSALRQKIYRYLKRSLAEEKSTSSKEFSPILKIIQSYSE